MGGAILTNRRALDTAPENPERYVLAPSRLLEVGPPPDQDTDPTAIVAVVLGRVRERATQIAGRAVDGAILIVPPGWGPLRRDRLRAAAFAAGLRHVDLVDAATPRAHRYLRDGRCSGDRVTLVCQVLPAADIWMATIDVTADRGVDDANTTLAARSTADPDAATGAAAMVSQALAAADLSTATIATTVLHAPSTHAPVLALAVRIGGPSAPTSSREGDPDAASIYLRIAPAHGRRGRGLAAGPIRSVLHHTPSVLVPLPAAGILLGLLIPALRAINPAIDDPSRTVPVLYTVGCSWVLINMLCFFQTIAIVLVRADRRLHTRPDLDETRRRDVLAHELRLAAMCTVAATAIITTIGAVHDPLLLPVVAFAGCPTLLMASMTLLVALLVRVGYSSAVRWQVFLRLPAATLLLATVGFICTVIVTLITYSIGDPDQTVPDIPAIDFVGAVATALAIVPLIYSRWDSRVIASPFVIGAVILMHVYATTTMPITATFVIVLMSWWLTRIRPAGAYSNPNHTAADIAHQLQPELPEPTAVAGLDSTST
jgi:hypothetical protein